MSRLIRGQDGHLVFPIAPKNTNLVEDVEFLLPVKFRQILLKYVKTERDVVINQQSFSFNHFEIWKLRRSQDTTKQQKSTVELGYMRPQGSLVHQQRHQVVDITCTHFKL